MDKVDTSPRVRYITWLATVALGLLALGQPLHLWGQASLDPRELTLREELSESLANALLEFSVAVRDRDLKRLASFFSPTIQALTFPAVPGTGRESSPWVRETPVDLSASPPNIPRDELMERWASLLNYFSELEDARFKVKEARFSTESTAGTAESETGFFLVGRNPEGKPLWVKGNISIVARHEPPDWIISQFVFRKIQMVSSPEDLFSEVSLPAGVSVTLPPYGSPGSDDFVYHGAAVGDLNRDGLMDILATGIAANYLYLNRGDGTFQEVSREKGLPPTPDDATAPLLLDHDNDGDLDVFLAAVGSQMLFENRLFPDGELSLVDVSLEAGVAVRAHGFGATAGDINRDGWPDIYVTSYNRYGRIMPNSWHQATNGTPNLLFINQGNGTFRESALEWEVADTRWGYAAQLVDFNGDHRLDLYLANDFGENALYLNRGDRFEDRARQTRSLDPGNGMGVSFGDYNNDGRLDLYVTNMSSTAGRRILERLTPGLNHNQQVLHKLSAGNTLLEGRPDGSFIDISEKKGPFAAGWAWGGIFIDFDNDGWQDLYSPNGFISGTSMNDT